MLLGLWGMWLRRSRWREDSCSTPSSQFLSWSPPCSMGTRAIALSLDVYLIVFGAGALVRCNRPGRGSKAYLTALGRYRNPICEAEECGATESTADAFTLLHRCLGVRINSQSPLMAAGRRTRQPLETISPGSWGLRGQSRGFPRRRRKRKRRSNRPAVRGNSLKSRSQ